MKPTYEEACSLAYDLAESRLAVDVMKTGIPHPDYVAKQMRQSYVHNVDTQFAMVASFGAYQEIINHALQKLIEGYQGYKLVKI